MNYEPNTQHWKPGEIVVHDADHKSPKMLMRVVGWTPDGLVKSVYVHPDHPVHDWHRKGTYENDAKYLHDPARFGIDPSGDPYAS